MIKVTVTGLQALEARFNNIGARLRAELKEANKEVGQYLEDATKKTFKMGGPGWKELSPVTVALKGNSRKLIDTGGYNSGISHKLNQTTISGEVFPDGPDYPRASKHLVAAVHEAGATVKNGWGRGITIVIPSRPVFLNTARRERKKVADIYLNAIRKIFS